MVGNFEIPIARFFSLSLPLSLCHILPSRQRSVPRNAYLPLEQLRRRVLYVASAWSIDITSSPVLALTPRSDENARTA